MLGKSTKWSVFFFFYKWAITVHVINSDITAVNTSKLLSTFWQLHFFAVHGVEYAFGAHDYPSSGVFEVEPRQCPGFKFRKSIFIGTTSLDPTQVREFMENHAASYNGDSYHLIFKNCNHFCKDVCYKLTGKPIPKWVNRLAGIGIQVISHFSSQFLRKYNTTRKHASRVIEIILDFVSFVFLHSTRLHKRRDKICMAFTSFLRFLMKPNCSRNWSSPPSFYTAFKIIFWAT